MAANASIEPNVSERHSCAGAAIGALPCARWGSPSPGQGGLHGKLVNGISPCSVRPRSTSTADWPVAAVHPRRHPCDRHEQRLDRDRQHGELFGVVDDRARQLVEQPAQPLGVDRPHLEVRRRRGFPVRVQVMWDWAVQSLVD